MYHHRYTMHTHEIYTQVLHRSFRCLIVGLLLWFPGPLAAQISFQWETRRQDTLYQAVEDCLGLLQQVMGRTLEWDTTAGPLREGDARLPDNTVSDSLTTAARHCSHKFSVDSLVASASTEPTLPLNAVRLLIAAKRDNDAIALVERWTAKLPPSEDSLRNWIRLQAGLLFLRDLPTRFAAIRRLADSIDFTSFWEWQIGLYGQIMERAKTLQDAAEHDSSVAWLLAVNQRTPDSIKQLPGWQGERPRRRGVGPYVVAAITWTQRVTLLEKLRHSTESYLDFLTVLHRSVGYKAEKQRVELAKPLIVEYWFPKQPAGDRPARGKVSVVVPRGGNICNPCWYREGWLGRVAERFPEVEFTLLTRTQGRYDRFHSTFSDDEEARLIDSIHRQVYGFPGMVAIYQTPWWRFEEPSDRRVVEEHGPNEDQYPLFGPTATRIIDRNGRFIRPMTFSLDPLESIMLLFDALINQPVP